MKKHPLKNDESKHYQLFDGLESIELVEKALSTEELIGACKFNILKYQLRLGKKDDIAKDIKKIDTYKKYLAYLKGS